MALRVRGRVVRLFSAAIVDQVVLSAGNLLVGLLLVRYTSDSDYAQYVLLQSGLVLVLNVHGGIVCGPLGILAPRREPGPKREMIGAIRASQNRLLRPLVLIALLVPAFGYLARLMDMSLALVCGIGIIAAWATVQRSYARNVLLIYSRLRALVLVDAAYVGVLLAGVLWAAFGFGVPIVWVAVALAAAAWISSASSYPVVTGDIGRATTDAHPIWREMRDLGLWYVVAVAIYWLYSRSYSYILATRLDLTAVANVNAVRLMIVPAQLIATGLQGVLTPMASAWMAEMGFDRMLRRLLGLTLLVGAGSLLYLSFIWITRDWVAVRVLHKHIADLDFMLLLWSVIAIISLVRDVLGPALNALGRMKWLAWQVGFCASISIIIMWFGIPIWGAAAVLIGMLVGETLNLAANLYSIRREHRRIRLSGDASLVGRQAS